MQYDVAPGVDKGVSRIVQGVVMLSGSEDDAEFALLDAVYQAGINTFDAAHVYAGGKCDRVLGRWVRSRGLRDHIVLLDKGCHLNEDRKRLTPFDLTADLHDCLARLKFDHIDVFALHRDDESMPVEPIVERLNEHVQEGKIRALGASNWSHERIRLANEYAEAADLRGFSLASPHYSLAECLDEPWGGGALTITGSENGEARQWYETTQMPLFAWSSLAGGFFSGRFTRGNLDSFTDGADRRCIRCFCDEENFRRLDRAIELAEEKDATPAQIALAYVLNGPLNCFALMAAWTTEQAAENARAAEICLTSREIEWLDLRREDR